MDNNFTKVAFVYLTKDNKVLLLQEGGALAKGLWSFPGGHVEEGESLEQCAIREALEESGYQVNIDKVIYKALISSLEYKGVIRDTETVDLTIFKADIVNGSLQIDDQALALKWFTKEEAINLPHRWSFIKDIILNN